MSTSFIFSYPLLGEETKRCQEQIEEGLLTVLRELIIQDPDFDEGDS